VKFRKGDFVLVTVGKDKGKKGKIEKIFPKKRTMLIAGVNMYKRHLKARGQNQPAGIIDIVKPLPLSSITIICPACSLPTRIGWALEAGGKKRICRKCRVPI
jgi:large subunit ribosomal protein L24